MNLLSSLTGLCAVGFFARLSYALARSPVLPLFALHLGAGPEAIGFVVGISTVTGIFFKLPSGALSDVIGRRKTMLIGLFVFALMPFAYLFVRDYYLLSIIRFLHGFATAVYGPVSMAVVADVAGAKKGEMLSWFSSVTITGNLLGAPVGGLMLYSTSSSAALVADVCKEKHFGAAMGTFGTIFDIGHASGPILAGILIAKWGYLHAFSFMGAMLILAVPVFMLSVDAGKPRKVAYEGIT